MVGLDGTIMLADVQTAPSFKVSTPRLLFKSRQDLVSGSATPDFQHFLEVVPVGAAAPNSITIELNWMSALKR